ncbi:MAG: pyridoxal phosphate-dependent aminotransferase [Alphaproteobacteria bacterium]|nr:pyridoxal phosphate-dependent aminotransferase [Alphaproteobacteria bacterium]
MNCKPALRPATRMKSVGLSEIVRISEKTNRLRAEGRDLITLSTGEPDFPTPGHVLEAANIAMRQGQTRYTPTAGTQELRQSICAAARRDLNINYAPSQVVVGTGAKQILFNLFMASLDPGDEVIIPAPYWTTYPDIVSVCGGTPVIVRTSTGSGMKITPDQLTAAITPRTRWLLVNSPANPTGALYSASELTALANVLRHHPHVGIVSDEIYQHIAFASFSSFGVVAPDLADRMVIVSGVSKAYAMTGWRIGWAIGPQNFINSLVAIQGQSTSGACSIAQAAAIAALEGPQDLLEERKQAFLVRRDLVVKELNAVQGLSCTVPDGAFYVFPSCHEAIGQRAANGTVMETEVDFCNYLLESEGVAVVPGRAFGTPGHVRVSFAYARQTLVEALGRIRRACEMLE